MSNRERASCNRLLKLWKRGGMMELLVRCRRHLEHWPELPGPYLLMGDILGRMARYQEGLRCIRSAGRSTPIVFQLLGDLYRRRHSYRKAADCYHQAALLSPDSKYLVSQALCLFDLGDLEGAELVLRGIPGAAYDLGRLYRSQARYREAAECWSRCLTLEPGQVLAQQALADVQAALQPAPRPPDAARDVPSYLEVPGPAEKAIRLEECLRLHPRSSAAYLDYASLLTDLRCYARAIEYGQQAVRLVRVQSLDLAYT